MLFKLHHDKSPFILNEGLKAIKEFVCLTDRQFTAVSLFADYESPLRTLPEQARREQAAIVAGWPMEGKRLDKNGRNFVDGKVRNIETAIRKYKEIQFDEDRETLAGIDRQIHEIRETAKEDKQKASTRRVVTKDGKIVDVEDNKLKYDLIEKAAKLTATLPSLYETKQKLQELLKLKDDTPTLTTFTSTDLDGEESSEELSTLDNFMKQQAKKE